MGIAIKSDPSLWEACRKEACQRGNMCEHSARKMQWASTCYQKKGGKYVGNKSPTNKLHQWTKQKWRTFSGRKSGGRLRYLPEKAWAHLTPEQIERTNRLKKKGHRQGKQWVKQPDDVARIARAHRTLKK